MKQLSGLDAAFLYMETPTTYGHVTGLMIFERPTAEFDAFQVVRAKYASLVGAIEPLRRRIVEVPFGLDHPYWIADPHFDLDFHVRELDLARPGRADQLADQVARIIARPMDRTRPLWEVYVIGGLDDGRWALLTKYHHATIDGASGQLMLQIMTDTDPDAATPGESQPWDPESIPAGSELLSMALANLARHPLKALRMQARLVRTFADAVGLDSLSGAARQASALLKFATQAESRPKLSLPLTPAPPTPWNRTISSHRRFAMRTASLTDVKLVKDATGATVNDVVMAVCAGALREYLLHHDALPDRPLRAMVPVSIRTGNEDDPWTNRVSSIFAELPTDSDDPLERVARCRAAMLRAKRQFELVPADALIDLTRFSPPVLATAAMRLVAQQRVADRITLPFNLVISNVPGPRQPLYFAGARMAHQFPISIVTDGQGLNVTVQSYLDRIDFGFVVDRELVPDVELLADLHVAEIDRLVAASNPAPAPQNEAKAGHPTKASAKAKAKRPATAKAKRPATAKAKRPATAKAKRPAKRSPKGTAKQAAARPRS